MPCRTGRRYLPVALPWVAAAVLAVVGWFLAPPLNFVLGWFFRMFNLGFKYSTNLYTRTIGLLLRVSALVLLVYGGLLFLTWLGFMQTPTGFIPQPGQGLSAGQRAAARRRLGGPDAAGDGGRRGDGLGRASRKRACRRRRRRHTVGISGQSILLNANAPNFGAMYLMLDEFGNRTGPGLSADAIAASLQAELQDAVPDAVVNIFQAPPIEGLGTAGGFKLIVEDRGNEGLDPAGAGGQRRHRPGRVRRHGDGRRPSKGCSPASGPRRRGSS